MALGGSRLLIFRLLRLIIMIKTLAWSRELFMLPCVALLLAACTGTTTPKPPMSSASNSSISNSSASVSISSLASSRAQSSSSVISSSASIDSISSSLASSVSMVPVADQCNNTGECRAQWSNATDCKNSLANNSVCLCGANRCDVQPTQSSSHAASSAPTGCSANITAGKYAYQEDCTGCHGDVPTNSSTQWQFGNVAIDVFDSDGNGYQTRDDSHQMLPLGDFIAMYMPTTSLSVGQPFGDNIAAYISDAVGQPWCPGQDWPDAGTPQPEPQPSIQLPPQSIGMGPYGTCAIKPDNTVKCWGGNYLLPRNKCDNKPEEWGKGPCVGRASAPNDLGKVKALSGMHTGACAILQNPSNPQKAIRCWGPEISPSPDFANPVQLGGGDRQSCAMNSAGQVICWAADTRFSNTVHTVPNGLAAKALSTGSDFSCAIQKADDKVTCWGPKKRNPPNDLKAKRIAVGGGYGSNPHACAIDLNDNVVCWGDGAGTNVPANLKAKSIAAGEKTSCAVRPNGSAVCWGAGANPPSGNDFIEVYANRAAAHLVKTDGTVVQFRHYGSNKRINMPNNFKIKLP